MLRRLIPLLLFPLFPHLCASQQDRTILSSANLIYDFPGSHGKMLELSAVTKVTLSMNSTDSRKSQCSANDHAQDLRWGGVGVCCLHIHQVGPLFVHEL